MKSGRVVRPAHEYTRLHIDETHLLRATDGLLTRLHEPQASHLNLLSAFLPAEEAIAQKYLWHEFGDLNLIV